jgi:excisionase family DNA binding protein
MQTKGDAARMLTVRQVAAELGVSVGLVYRLIATGELAGHRFGAALRVRAGDLARYIERTQTAG